MKKKLWTLLALVLCLCLMAATLTACGEDPVETDPTDETPGWVSGGHEADVAGTWLREDGAATITMDGEMEFEFALPEEIGMGTYAFDGETLFYTVVLGDNEEPQEYYGTLEDDGSLYLDDLGGRYSRQAENGGVQQKLLGTWDWSNEENQGTFTFTVDYVEYTYVSMESGGAGTAPYTVDANGVTLDVNIEAFGDGVFVFQDDDTLVNEGGAILTRQNGGGEAPEPAGDLEPGSGGYEGLLMGQWIHSESDGYLYFDGLDQVEVNTVDEIVYYYYAYDGVVMTLFDTEDGSTTEGFVNNAGDLTIDGFEGYYVLDYAEGNSLDGTSWDNDAMEESLVFEGELFTLGNWSDDFVIYGYYFFDGSVVTLETEDGSFLEAVLDGQGRLTLEGYDSFFFQVDLPAYLP